MRRTAGKTGLMITSAAAGLATLSQCSAGLIGDLFDKHADKDRAAVERRLPPGDCSFGYYSTAWQPWGTCGQTANIGCANGVCRTMSPSILPGFQPGYSSDMPVGNPRPYHDAWPQPGTTVISPEYPSEFPGDQSLQGDGPTPILMTPQDSEPTSDSQYVPPHAASPQLVNPFPRAVITNPELPEHRANPYPAPSPGQSLPTPPQSERAFGVPLDPPQPSFNHPTRPANTPHLPEPASNFESSGTGINLPPRRATSVTIDIPKGSSGTTLSLPDPLRSGEFGGASSPAESPSTGLPTRNDATRKVPGSGFPAVSPGASGPPPTPEPSLRPQPPLPVPSALPDGSSAAYQYPGIPPQQFQPATHWQAVPQRQPSQQTNWRVMQGAGSQPVPPQSQQQTQDLRRPLTPSERVIYLSPPPRR